MATKTAVAGQYIDRTGEDFVQYMDGAGNVLNRVDADGNLYAPMLVFPNLNNVIIVDGNTYARTDAGIQAAINACPDGGTVYLPAGEYSITTGNIAITQPINIVGAGNGTLLSVASALGATVDIFVVNPTSNGSFIRFVDFQILPVSGAPGRYGIHLNGASSVINNFSMERVVINQLGSSAVFAEGSGEGQGTPVVSNIEYCYLVGGIVCTNCGDTFRILNNTIPGTGNNNFSFQAGASTFIFQGNNVTVSGGTRLGSGCLYPQIVENEFETEAGFTGSNSALLDIDGTSPSSVLGAKIIRNSFQVLQNTAGLIGVRLNFTTQCSVLENTFERGSGAGATDITATSNAFYNYVGNNYWVGGIPSAAAFSDSGVTDTLVFVDPIVPGLTLGNTQSINTVDVAGTASFRMLYTDNTDSVALNGFHGTGLLYGENGQVLYFDGTASANVAMVLSDNASAAPNSATVVSAYNYSARGTLGVTQTAGAPTSIATIGGIVTTLVVTSDERLKDTLPYSGGLKEILAITPVSYTWNDLGHEVTGDTRTQTFVGFGAQNVQAVIPESIVGQQVAKDGTVYLGFDDRPVIAALVNAIKTLEARIKVLESK